MLFYLKGNNSKMGDNLDKKKKYGSPIFSWGIHIWNFKTLAYMVLKLCYAPESVTNERTNVTNERTDMPEAICPPTPNFFQSWGHNKLAFSLVLQNQNLDFLCSMFPQNKWPCSPHPWNCLNITSEIQSMEWLDNKTMVDYWVIGHDVMSTIEYQYWPLLNLSQYWYWHHIMSND